MASSTVVRSPPSPPYSLRERERQDVVLGQQLDHVPWELGLLVDLGGAGRDLFVGKLRDGVAQRGLLFGQLNHGRDASAGRASRPARAHAARGRRLRGYAPYDSSVTDRD